MSALSGLGIQFVDVPILWKQGFTFFGLMGCVITAIWFIYLHFWGVKNTYREVLDKYLSYNTTDRHPLMVLIDSGVLKIYSEDEVKMLMAEIRERREYDPFTDFSAVPEGQMLEALRRVRDERIDVTKEKHLFIM